MKKLIEKIIEKLEEIQIENTCSDCQHKEKCDEVQENISDEKTDLCGATIKALAIEIVKQTAEEFGTDRNVGSNGWIPCSERLPEEHKLYDITFKNSAGIHSDSAIYNPYLKIWLWDADETELVENEILAWAEKREPYQTKGE